MFRELGSRVNFADLEEGVLRFWKDRHIFERSVRSREQGPHFTFYEGPPTANGSPGVHHVLSRVYKDVVCRYRAMKGWHVPRKAGWDTHGLPVELEVEGSLALTNKAQIEEYGVARFNERCRESALKYIREWETMTERLGCWLDMEHPYRTLDRSYVESCWWIVKQLWDRGLVYHGYKVAPHCPRCGTSLSSHEVALGYRDDAEDPSVYIRFAIQPGSVAGTPLEQLVARFRLKPAYLLAWTTTPWTLPGNTALAVAPDADYVVMEGEDDYLVVASALAEKLGLDGYSEAVRVKGADIAGKDGGLRYVPLFNPHEYAVERRRFTRRAEGVGGGYVELEAQPEDAGLAYPVVGTAFVSLEEGTGVVHMAPAFGELDFEAGEDNDLDFVQPVDLDGKVVGSYPFAGKFVKDADGDILRDLASRGLLYRSEKIVHTYPFCWRCSSPLLYYAKRSWYIRTTAVKDELISGNAGINWYPEYIKRGRFGDWLSNNVDWAVSRERYWGTPLNVWRCSACERLECVGGVAELQQREGVNAVPPDLHRPYVDEITFRCAGCGGEMRRVPEVLDCWFDSGAMPVAQWHYPFENKPVFEQNFPADFICEAVDQTRGWFYSLHAIATLLFERPCFRNVICLGHVVDAKGEKMSKSKGNVVDPWAVIGEHGADALRWYMLGSTAGEEKHRFSSQMVLETRRRFVSTLWNTYSFFALYANIDSFVPGVSVDRPCEKGSASELDRWIVSELNRLVAEVTKLMDAYNPTGASRRIEEFVDGLSNWYVRRSRRRFWKSENDADKASAYAVLYDCLTTLSGLLAPFMPFVAEELYQALCRAVDPGAEESVHLTGFPVADEDKIDNDLNDAMILAMRVSSLGRAARAKAGIKVRQPLRRAVVRVGSEAEKRALNRCAAEIVEEINVKELEISCGVGDSAECSGVAESSVASDAKCWIAVDTALSPELLAEGLSREIVRHFQNMRRNAGFDISDHIIAYYQAEEPVRGAMVEFADYIRRETLSLELVDCLPDDGVHVEKHRIANTDVLLGVRKAP